ncbi:MAG: rhodanese-like domain-containing protein [Desulfobacteraceae bacterium]|nr:rhodanese-like domain-containing protein [Desulfobacteraceae bacterium]
MHFRICVLFVMATLIIPVVVPAAEKIMTPESLPGVTIVDTATVKEWLDEGDDFIILDARKASDYDVGHLPGAELATVPSDLNISDEAVAKSLSALEEADVIQDLEKDTKLVIYCNGAT